MGAGGGLETDIILSLLHTKYTSSSGLMLFRLFSRHISRTQSFQEYRHFLFQVRVVLNTLVSLMGRLEPCNARIAADRRTDTDCKPSLRMRPPRELITIRGLHRPLVLNYIQHG